MHLLRFFAMHLLRFFALIYGVQLVGGTYTCDDDGWCDDDEDITELGQMVSVVHHRNAMENEKGDLLSCYRRYCKTDEAITVHGDENVHTSEILQKMRFLYKFERMILVVGTVTVVLIVLLVCFAFPNKKRNIKKKCHTCRLSIDPPNFVEKSMKNQEFNAHNTSVSMANDDEEENLPKKNMKVPQKPTIPKKIIQTVFHMGSKVRKTLVPFSYSHVKPIYDPPSTIDIIVPKHTGSHQDKHSVCIPDVPMSNGSTVPILHCMSETFRSHKCPLDLYPEPNFSFVPQLKPKEIPSKVPSTQVQPKVNTSNVPVSYTLKCAFCEP